MSRADDMDADDISQRTAIAVDAQMTAFKAHTTARQASEKADEVELGFIGLKRHAARIHWVWGVLAFLLAVGGAGYILRDRIEHFATKEKVEANSDDIDRIKMEQKEMNAILRGIIDTQKRTLDGVDDVKRILMNERRR